MDQRMFRNLGPASWFVLAIFIAAVVLVIWLVVRAVRSSGRRTDQRKMDGVRGAYAAFDGTDVVRFPLSTRSGPTRAQVEAAASESGYTLLRETEQGDVTLLTFTKG